MLIENQNCETLKADPPSEENALGIKVLVRFKTAPPKKYSLEDSPCKVLSRVLTDVYWARPDKVVVASWIYEEITEMPRSVTDNEENIARTYSNPFQLLRVLVELVQNAPK